MDSPLRKSKPLFSIHTDGNSGPYLLLEPENIAAVSKLLDDAKIPYVKDTDAVSERGDPALSAIDLGDGADLEKLRELLGESNKRPWLKLP